MSNASQNQPATQEINTLREKVVKQEEPIEAILKKQYGVYLQNKHLIQDLFEIKEKTVLEPYQYLWEKGGKKIRVIAALLINDLFNQTFQPDVIRIGGLIELLHCASLIIDDIEDSSIKRRGQPCSHIVYGIDYAINAANLMYFLPINKLIDCLPDAQQKWRVTQVYMQQMTLCHIGQGLDVKVHKANYESELPSSEQYYRMTSLKTGGLLRMLVNMLGVILDLPSKALNILCECMNNVGIAFQIIDDVLNLTNIENNLGKGIVAEDLYERKFTLIVDHLRQNEEFMTLFFMRHKTEETVQKLLGIIKKSDAIQKCQEKAKQYAEKAIECVQKLPCPRSKVVFEKFIRYLIERKN